MDLSDEKLRGLLELEASATDGPWDYTGHQIKILNSDRTIAYTMSFSGADGSLIYESRNHFRPLVEEVLRLREELRSYEWRTTEEYSDANADNKDWHNNVRTQKEKGSE